MMTREDASRLISSIFRFCRSEMDEGNCSEDSNCESCPIWRACQKIAISFINKQPKEEKTVRFTKRHADGFVALERNVSLSEALQRLAQFEDITFGSNNNMTHPGYSQYRAETPGRDYLSAGTIVVVRKVPASPSVTFQNNSQNNFQNSSPSSIHTRIVRVRKLNREEGNEDRKGNPQREAEDGSKGGAGCSGKCEGACDACRGKHGGECEGKHSGECRGECSGECRDGKKEEAGHAAHDNTDSFTPVPCKTGDALFVLTSDSPFGYEFTICTRICVRNDSTGKPSCEVVYAPTISDSWDSAMWVLRPEDFGVKVFLNQQDAENARDGRRDECGEEKKDEAGDATHDNADPYTPVPCKPGDTMFVLTSNSHTGYVVVKCTNIGVRLDLPTPSEFADAKRVESNEKWRFRPEDFGKMVFLRRQDMLNALKNRFK